MPVCTVKSAIIVADGQIVKVLFEVDESLNVESEKAQHGYRGHHQEHPFYPRESSWVSKLKEKKRSDELASQSRM